MNGASLIAIHEGRYYKRSDGLALGPGAFIKGLEYSSNVKAEVVGKPTIGFFKAALGEINPAQAVMIGDVTCFELYCRSFFYILKSHFSHNVNFVCN